MNYIYLYILFLILFVIICVIIVTKLKTIYNTFDTPQDITDSSSLKSLPNLLYQSSVSGISDINTKQKISNKLKEANSILKEANSILKEANSRFEKAKSRFEKEFFYYQDDDVFEDPYDAVFADTLTALEYIKKYVNNVKINVNNANREKNMLESVNKYIDLAKQNKELASLYKSLLIAYIHKVYIHKVKSNKTSLEDEVTAKRIKRITDDISKLQQNIVNELKP